MSADRAAVAALAERISATLTEECLSWGEAINAAEAAKGTASHEALAKLARIHGARVAELSASIALRLRGKR